MVLVARRRMRVRPITVRGVAICMAIVVPPSVVVVCAGIRVAIVVTPSVVVGGGGVYAPLPALFYGAVRILCNHPVDKWPTG